MPYRRAGFALTPPSLVIFVISLVLAALAFLVHYAHVSVPIISSSRVFDDVERCFGEVRPDDGDCQGLRPFRTARWTRRAGAAAGCRSWSCAGTP